MKNIRKIFLTGLLIILPIGITLYIVYISISFLDNLLGTPIKMIVGFKIPGVGIVAAAILIFLIGFVSSHYLGKKLAQLVEKIFSSIPIVRTVYSPVRDIIKTLMGTEKESFLKVVLVEFPMHNSKSIGFITNENIVINNEKYYSIFVPTTPNPTSGYLIIKKPDDIMELDVTIEEGIKMVVSMNTTKRDEIRIKGEW